MRDFTAANVFGFDVCMEVHPWATGSTVLTDLRKSSLTGRCMRHPKE
jgi:hypothetical protein